MSILILQRNSQRQYQKFVNGVLDNIVKDLIKQGLIVKTGRGLIT